MARRIYRRKVVRVNALRVDAHRHLVQIGNSFVDGGAEPVTLLDNFLHDIGERLAVLVVNMAAHGADFGVVFAVVLDLGLEQSVEPVPFAGRFDQVACVVAESRHQFAASSVNASDVVLNPLNQRFGCSDPAGQLLSVEMLTKCPLLSVLFAKSGMMTVQKEA